MKKILQMALWSLTLLSAWPALTQAQFQAQTLKVNTNAWDAILTASPVVQLTLSILVVLSILTWGVALSKFFQFKKLKEADEDFLNHFIKANSLDSLAESLDPYLKHSSLARIFKSGYSELQKLAQKNQNAHELSKSDNFDRSLRKAMEFETSLLESRLTILATTGSTGPFIGLFGTVWGIMGSFQKIGVTGSASLAVVAPGIAEALVATAIGLAAAIPAVMFYNHFMTKIRKQELEMNNFYADFMNIARRSFFKE